MAASTGPLIAMGAITVANQVLLNDRPFDIRVPVATGVLVLIAAGAERVAGDLVVGIAWLALLTSFVARTKADTPSPAESLVRVLGMRERAS